jgi:hypothetical protein
MDILSKFQKKKGEAIWETHDRLSPFLPVCKALGDSDLYASWSLDMFEELLILVLGLCEKNEALQGVDFDEKIKRLSQATSFSLTVKKDFKEIGPATRALIDAYYRLFHGPDVEEWMSLRIGLLNFYKYLREPIHVSDKPDTAARAKTAVMKEIQKFKTELLKIEARVFGSEEAAKILAEEEGSSYLGSYAEEFAKEYKY